MVYPGIYLHAGSFKIHADDMAKYSSPFEWQCMRLYVNPICVCSLSIYPIISMILMVHAGIRVALDANIS